MFIVDGCGGIKDNVIRQLRITVRKIDMQQKDKNREPSDEYFSLKDIMAKFIKTVQKIFPII